MSEDVDDVGEEYLDVVKGEVRRKRGRRKHSRGPYSGAEKKMKLAFYYMMASMHWMDGELADMVARHFAAQYAAQQAVLKRYSYDLLPDPQPEDWEALREELGIAETVVEDGEQFDLGDLVLCATRARER